DLEAALLECGQQHLARRTGIRRGLEDDELAVAQDLGYRLRRCDDVADVRIACLAERRRYTDRDDVALGQAGGVGRRLEATARARFAEHHIAHVLDVRASLVQAVDDGLRDVVADDVEAPPRHLDAEWQSYISEPDDAAYGGAVLDLRKQGREGVRLRGGCFALGGRLTDCNCDSAVVVVTGDARRAAPVRGHRWGTPEPRCPPGSRPRAPRPPSRGRSLRLSRRGIPAAPLPGCA